MASRLAVTSSSDRPLQHFHPSSVLPRGLSFNMSTDMASNAIQARTDARLHVIAYNTSKAAANSYTIALALELRKEGIRCHERYLIGFNVSVQSRLGTLLTVPGFTALPNREESDINKIFLNLTGLTSVNDFQDCPKSSWFVQLSGYKIIDAKQYFSATKSRPFPFPSGKVVDFARTRHSSGISRSMASSSQPTPPEDRAAEIVNKLLSSSNLSPRRVPPFWARVSQLRPSRKSCMWLTRSPSFIASAIVFTYIAKIWTLWFWNCRAHLWCFGIRSSASLTVNGLRATFLASRASSRVYALNIPKPHEPH